MSTEIVLAAGFTDEVLAPLQSGIVAGAIYGLIALGIVLIYKSNKIFNFAQAEFGTVAALIAQAFRAGRDGFPRFPLWLACILGVSAAVLLAVGAERLIIRPLFRASRITLVVATAGITLLLIQLELFIGGANLVFFEPFSRAPIGFLSTGIVQTGYTEVFILLSLVAVAVAAIGFFRTRYGTAILAVSMEPTAASGVGISVSQVSVLTWGLSGLIGGIAGVALAPGAGTLTPGFMTFTGPLIVGFVAAVVGGMTSLPGAFLGGIVIGVIEAFSNSLAPSSIPGFASLVVFVVLLGVLLVRPKGLLGKEV